jgi:hypothetical protein
MAETNKDKWCFAWAAALQASAGKSRAALVKAARWNPGDVITVCFLDGDSGLQERVRAAAKKWVGDDMANLRFSFQKKTDALIRISFNLRGSWSTIGTTCRNVDKSRPTMNFGWLTPASSDKEMRRVVLHEFGHALGLIHEHQSPAGGIDWNREQVKADLSGPSHYWTAKQIQTNMFNVSKKSETNFTKFDKDSIMLYPIPARWTNDGFSSVLNTKLSPSDIRFIRKQYPHF